MVALINRINYNKSVAKSEHERLDKRGGRDIRVNERTRCLLDCGIQIQHVATSSTFTCTQMWI